MRGLFIPTLLAALALAACSTSEVSKNPSNPAPGKAAASADVQIVFPFKEFASVGTDAKAGEFVLVPSYNWIEDAVTKGVGETTFIWYSQKMKAPGKDFSEVEFIGESKTVPNAYIIAIPRGQEAKVGDIVVTWWQTGSGMQRAIVVDDKNPAEPVVRYLDLAYDNPAKSRDGKTTIGQMDEKLSANSFFLAKEMGPGTGVAIRSGSDSKSGILITQNGENVLVKGFAGKMEVHPKSAVTPVPLRPPVQGGDKVQAVSIDTFSSATVTRVDARIGRVFVKFDGRDREEAVPFGNVMKQ